MTKFLLSALLPAALCQSAYSDVNMRDGSYIQTWTDFRWTDSKPTRSGGNNILFDLNRIYNSRNLRQGIFGFGWCSEIETTLHWQGSQILVSDCEGTHNKKAHQKNKFWWVKLATGGFQKFNRQGRLVALQKTQNSPLVELFYQQDRLISLSFPHSELRFFYSQISQNLSFIEAYQNEKLVLHKDYQLIDNNLVSVGKSSVFKINYRYDEFHNLVEWSDTQQKFYMTYDVQKDQIQSIHSSNGCQEKYSYQKVSSTVLQSRLDKICLDKKTHSQLFRFEAFKQANQTLFLRKILVSDNDRPLQPLRVGETNDFKSLP